MGRTARATELTRRLFGNPWFPILFIGEAVKNSAFHLIAGSPSADIVGASIGMSVVSVVMWLYCYDDVKWGLQKIEEVAEDVADE